MIGTKKMGIRRIMAAVLSAALLFTGTASSMGFSNTSRIKERVVPSGVSAESASFVSASKVTVNPGTSKAREEYYDRTSGDYGYRDITSVLRSDAMKSVYEQIDEAVKSFFVDGISLSPDDRRIVTVNTEGMGLSADRIRETITLFYADHPICFFMDTSISYRHVSGSVYDFTISCYPEYISSSDRNEEFEKIIKILNSYVDYCEGAVSRYDRLSSVIFKMSDDNVYAYDSNGYPERSDWAHSIVGIMSPDYEGGVCESYVRSLQLIMNYMGIPCITVLGETEGKNHAWNLVMMDDDKYYWIDPNWCDYDFRGYDKYSDTAIGRKTNIKDYPGAVNYKYFLQGDSFREDHSEYLPTGSGNDYLYRLPSVSESAYENNIGTEGTAGDFTYRIVQDDGVRRRAEIIDSNIKAARNLNFPSSLIIDGKEFEVVGVDISFLTSGIMNAVIPEGVRYITGLINNGETTVSGLYIPSTVDYIENPYFSYAKLRSLTVAEGNPNIKSAGGAMYDAEGKTLIRLASLYEDESVVIPATVEKVAQNALLGCNSGSIYIENPDIQPTKDWFQSTDLKVNLSQSDGSRVQAGWMQYCYPKDTRCYVYTAENSSFAEYVLSGGAPWMCIRSGEPDKTVRSGDCGSNGSNVTWRLSSDNKTLTISGTGAMADFYNNGKEPGWQYAWGDTIEKVVVGEGVTSVNTLAFYGDSGIRTATLGTTVSYVGDGAFSGCSSLEKITMDISVGSIRQGTFSGTPKLSRVNFTGKISFNEFWGNLGKYLPMPSLPNQGYMQAEITYMDDERIKHQPFKNYIHTHSITHFPAVSEAVNVQGNKEFWYCSGCNSFFGNDAGTVMINERIIDIPMIMPEKPVLFVLGDVTGDSMVDANDLTILARHVAKIEIVEGSVVNLSADVNKDKSLDANDLTILARHVAKIELLPTA